MAQTPDVINAPSKWTNWYVLTTHNPKHLEDLIAQENILNGGQYDCYCPFTSLPEESDEAKAKNLYSLRAALRRYVFVRTLKTIEESAFVSTVLMWSRESAASILFLRNTQNVNAKVSPRELDVMKAFCDKELFKPDEHVSVRDLKVGQTIRLSNTPIADSDTECVIQSVTRKRGIVELRVEMTLFNVKFSNLLVTYEDTDDGGSSSDLVYDIQQKLFAIFRRKINLKETEATRQQDEKTLRDIFENSDLPFPEGAMYRHFLALMLICARLMNDRDALQKSVSKVNAELSTLANLRESKAATDSRAWLHIALFIATGRPQYRNFAKAYIREHNPKSRYLQQFVKMSCKTAGEKWIGLRKKRK